MTSKTSAAKPRRLVLFVDGASRGNPGPAAYGVASEDGTVSIGESIGRGTNNEAEWHGFLAALRYAAAAGVLDLEVRADSQLVVRQFSGEYKVRAEHLRGFLTEARALATKFHGLAVVHVPRELNTKADALANEALDVLSAKANAR